MITPTSYLFPIFMAASSRRCCRSLPLKYHAQYAKWDTVATTAILRLICWTGRFIFGRYFAWDKHRSIKADVSIPPRGTLLTFSCPLWLIFSSHISNADILIVLHICFHTYPTLPSSSHIYFFKPIISPLCYISSDAISIALRLHQRICWHHSLPSMSYRVSSSAVITNLIHPFIFQLPFPPSPHFHCHWHPLSCAS